MGNISKNPFWKCSFRSMSFFQIAGILLLMQPYLYIGETGSECLVYKNSLQKAGPWKPLVLIDEVGQFETLVFFVEEKAHGHL